jgi:hypothetical protein
MFFQEGILNYFRGKKSGRNSLYIGGGSGYPNVAIACHDQHPGICPHYCTNKNIINAFGTLKNATTIAETILRPQIGIPNM